MALIEVEQLDEGQLQISFADPEAAKALLGPQGRHLKLVAEAAGVSARSRGSQVTLEGPAEGTALARSVLSQLYELIRQGYPVYEMDVDLAFRLLAADPSANLKDIFLDQVYLTGKKRV
ncbi:MAG: phosphate starvation-inducible protein PhoH, partial [Desulfovibrio sp.]|nr:phosphate starvation-inducible protein PhoH [Desulfovibrio sp.]